MEHQYKIEKGLQVIHQGAEYQVMNVRDMNSVIALNMETKHPVVLQINELHPVSNNPERFKNISAGVELESLPQYAWDKAMHKYNIIKPLLELSRPAKSIVEALAAENNMNACTIYRWLYRYRKAGCVSGLIDLAKGCAGSLRLPHETDAIITAIIEEKYLNKQKLTALKIHNEVKLSCMRNGLTPPCYGSTLRRINLLSEKIKTERRMDRSVAINKYHPTEGHFPDAEFPLACVQIDHTLMDIMLVDEVQRRSIGRPWITVAIDVYSRMVLGFYMSLDPPGTLGTGLCIANSILPKEMWLAKMDVKGEWPCYGLMRTIQLDNAKEFHGIMLQRACHEYGIEIDFRPVKKPNYGGHIERLMGTFAEELHSLPGTTFSDKNDRQHYDAEGMACFTMKEIEQWLLTYITGVYHQRVHTAIKCSPIARYTAGILGDDKQPGIGLSRPLLNEWKIKLDFMPVVQRKLQREGVVIDNIWYYHDVLRKWIYEGGNKGIGKKKASDDFIFKRDPRDISVIYFYDPELKEYYPIPYRNLCLPPITLWEYKEVFRTLTAQGRSNINEEMIFAALEQMRGIQQQAVDKVKAARRHKKIVRQELAINNSIKKDVVNAYMEGGDEDVTALQIVPGDIKPYEDIDYGSFN